jgi:hypothetical protein
MITETSNSLDFAMMGFIFIVLIFFIADSLKIIFKHYEKKIKDRRDY